ncbi:MAG: hypothetical protein R3257_07085, partial [bacterium]|nr:hypothetical protein [bacterium]
MNIKRLILSIIIIAIYIVLFEWGFHGHLLRGIYETTPDLWRSQAQMPAYLPIMTLGQVIFAIGFCLVFAWGYRGPGIGKGVVYGFLIGLMGSAASIIWYSVTPISTFLMANWI